MSRLAKIIRNVILIIIFILFIFSFLGIRLTPLSAHEYSEKGIHYGPSEVVRVIDHDDFKHILCKYDKWVSCNTVNRALLFFWSVGNQPIGFENNTDDIINYRYSYNGDMAFFYGIVNDTSIRKIEIYRKDEILTQEELYDDLFYFYWENENGNWDVDKIVGYNADGEIVAEVNLAYY